MLPPSSAEPDPWRTSRLPFLREIMDCLVSTSGVDRVVVMKAAQVGGTECALNFIGYAIHQVPANIMLVMPSTEMIRRNTPTRIDPLIEHTPVLRSLVVPFRSRDGGNSTTRKAFIGGELVMVGANSPLGLRSLPARYILLDEIDGLSGRRRRLLRTGPAGVVTRPTSGSGAIRSRHARLGRFLPKLARRPFTGSAGFFFYVSAYRYLQLGSERHEARSKETFCGCLPPTDWVPSSLPSLRRNDIVVCPPK